MIQSGGVRYRSGTGYPGAADAQHVGEELAALASRDGINAADVVKAAEDESSVLHRYFTWDDAAAAYLYRCEEARALIRSIEVVVSEDEEKSETVRAFHLVRQKENEDHVERRYYPLNAVVERSDWADQVVERARMELIGFRKRYSRYQKYIRRNEALSRAFDAIHELEDDS